MTTHVFEDGRGTRPGPGPGKEMKNARDMVVGVVVVMEMAEVEVVGIDLCRSFCSYPGGIDYLGSEREGKQQYHQHP